MGATITIEGLDKLQAGVNAAPATLAREVRTAMEVGSRMIEATARDLAPHDTGRLAASIAHSISGSGASLTSQVGPRVAYAYWVEHGRGPGKAPPLGAIGPWASRHGAGGPGRNSAGQFTASSAAFLIARAIARRGTKARPFLRPAFDTEVGRVTRLFGQIPGVTVRVMAS